jgi:hypothetical protein
MQIKSTSFNNKWAFIGNLTTKFGILPLNQAAYSSSCNGLPKPLPINFNVSRYALLLFHVLFLRLNLEQKLRHNRFYNFNDPIG